MIDFPATIPPPTVTLSGASDSPVARTQIEGGLIEQTGRFATALETYSVAWLLTESELAAFEAFFVETLAGGVLTFNLNLPDGSGYSAQPVRFVDGDYSATHSGVLHWNVNAKIEKLVLTGAAINRTPAVPQWVRLTIDPAESQNLSLAHRNALLVARPDAESQTTLRVYPPNSPESYIYFGIVNQGAGDVLITSEDVDPLPPYTPQEWPESLPGVNRTFQLSARQDVARLDMDGGHPRQYAKGETASRTHSANWQMTLAQLKTFQDFFYTTLENGTLAFWIDLPVDGLFAPVLVRFAKAKFSESYIFHDTFQVSGQLERITPQALTPSEAQPFPLYYGPTVEVNATRKMRDAAGKFFVVNPDAGETIKLHIYNLNPEFGLLVIGPGNVLITRQPYLYDLGSLPGDSPAGSFETPVLDLHDTLATVSASDSPSGAFAAPAFYMGAPLLDVGTLPGDSPTGEFAKPSLDMLAVLEDLGSLTADTPTGIFAAPIFDLS
jgi:hypothetical protein